MGHIGDNAPPDILLKVLIMDTPADRPEGRPVISDIVDNHTVSTSARITNQCTAHSGAEASNSTVLPRERILCRVVPR